MLWVLTELLDTAIAKVSFLPPNEQDRIAEWLLAELPDEERWDKRFSETQHALSTLAAESALATEPPNLMQITCELACDTPLLVRISRTISRGPDGINSP